jgi:hypothetical protein
MLNICKPTTNKGYPLYASKHEQLNLLYNNLDGTLNAFSIKKHGLCKLCKKQ